MGALTAAGASGETPRAGTMLASAIGADALLAAGMVLLLVALGALIAAVVSRRQAREAARLARARAGGMRDLLRTIHMAETISGLGIWQYHPATGAQRWSEGLRRLFGIDEDETFQTGDAETLLQVHGIDLVAQVDARCGDSEPFEMRFDIVGYDAIARTIAVHACNLVSEDGTLERVVAVIRDVTEETRRERELETARREAVDEARRVKMLAETDALTGLANRRRAMATLDREVMAARSGDASLILVMFDIDHFKRVNDTHGHAEGDAVLQKVARIAARQARKNDLVGRVGGEEFVWVVRDSDEQSVRAMSERLRRAIAKGSGTNSTPPVTISLGYAVLQPQDTALSLFARADAALYDAKGAGRNTVRMAA